MTLHAEYQLKLAAIVADCGGLGRFTALCEKLHTGTALFGAKPDNEMAKRITALHEWRNQQIQRMSAILGDHTTCRHAAKYNRPELVEVILPNGSGHLGYDLIDALETAIHERGQHATAAATVNETGRREERETNRDDRGRESTASALGRSG